VGGEVGGGPGCFGGPATFARACSTCQPTRARIHSLRRLTIIVALMILAILLGRSTPLDASWARFG
jgi:hypothetical protein